MTAHSIDNTLDYLMEGFQLISFDWRYLYVNDAVVKQSKFSRELLIGYTMMEKYPGIDQTDMFKTLQHCMYERVSEQLENEFKFPDGSSAWFELHIQPVPEGIFILSVDISRRKQAELELLKLNENLEQMVAVRTSQLESKNKDIRDSLNYAKDIQRAFLPSKPDFEKNFPDSLIIYKPKDIVSGDFYWYKKIKDRIILAMADCTGHGVPGALMSMIGIEKLNNVTRKTKEPAEILKQLNKSIKLALSQSNMYEHGGDGMDMAICSIDLATGRVTFAGANRPMWIIRHQKNMIEEINFTRRSIGGIAPINSCFDSYELILDKGDAFYLFSDGYADTFGGENGKKLRTAKFREVLLDASLKPMAEQEKHLDTFIEGWKAGIEQIDDILVVGVRM